MLFPPRSSREEDAAAAAVAGGRLNTVRHTSVGGTASEKCTYVKTPDLLFAAWDVVTQQEKQSNIVNY